MRRLIVVSVFIAGLGAMGVGSRGSESKPTRAAASNSQIAALATTGIAPTPDTRLPTPAAKTPDTRPRTPAKTPVVHVTPEMIRHSRINIALYFVDVVYGIAILLLVLATG